jgi:hypothetical protein
MEDSEFDKLKKELAKRKLRQEQAIGEDASLVDAEKFNKFQEGFNRKPATANDISPEANKDWFKKMNIFK